MCCGYLAQYYQHNMTRLNLCWWYVYICLTKGINPDETLDYRGSKSDP